MANSEALLLNEVVSTLNMTQRELAEVLGSSLRTVQRIYRGRSSLQQSGFARLAAAVHPKNPGLAERLAAQAGSTLVGLGIVAPPAPLPPPKAPVEIAPAAPSAPPSPHAADSVLCAVADLMNLPPKSVLSIVRAAFVRARELGLSVEGVTTALLALEAVAPVDIPK